VAFVAAKAEAAAHALLAPNARESCAFLAG